MKKLLEKITVVLLYTFCIFVIVELVFNYSALYCLFPIKNNSSYGYISKITNEVIVPLDKYKTRYLAQIALPYEYILAKINNKDLIKSYDRKLGKFGYIDTENKTAIPYKFTKANEFIGEIAVVAIEKNGKEKYGTINTKGEWVIEPKYDFLCPFSSYYIKACLDKNHCGVIDRFGNEITLMTYDTHRLQCKNNNCSIKFCQIGNKENNLSCNYFL